MMFDTKEEFSYFKCSNCGCLQILSEPTSMEKYYPDNYYSYNSNLSLLNRTKVLLRDFLALNGPSALFSGQNWFERGDIKSIRDAKIRRSDRILDIGCGDGWLIRALADQGFTKVQGADPFISEDRHYSNHVSVLKRSIDQITGQWDVVMMHHSLEHIWDQQAVLRNIERLLKPGGKAILRIPTVDSYAWEKYGTDWFQIDAPRHFYLHSRNSIALLVDAAGLNVDRIVDDSHELQIIVSERYKRGFSLVSASEEGKTNKDLFGEAFIRDAMKQSRGFNERGEGDMIAVHITKPV